MFQPCFPHVSWNQQNLAEAEGGKPSWGGKQSVQLQAGASKIINLFVMFDYRKK